MPGSRSIASVVTAPQRTPAIPGNTTADPRVQAATANDSSAATANANMTQNDPIYSTLGGVKTQVAIPGVPIVSDTSPTNTNLFLYFSVSSSSPYRP